MKVLSTDGEEGAGFTSCPFFCRLEGLVGIEYFRDESVEMLCEFWSDGRDVDAVNVAATSLTQDEWELSMRISAFVRGVGVENFGIF